MEPTCPYCGEQDCICTLLADEPLPDYDATLAVLAEEVYTGHATPLASTVYDMATLLGYRR